MKKFIANLWNRNLILAYVCRGAGVFFAFALNVVLARLFGGDISGKYYAIYNFMAIISSVAFLGLSYVIVHYLTPYFSRHEKVREGNVLMSLSIYALIAMLIVVGVLVFIFSDELSYYLFKSNEYINLIRYSVAIMFPYTGLLFLAEVFKSIKKVNTSIIVTNVVNNCTFILLLILFSKSKSIELIVKLYMISSIICFLIVLLYSMHIFKQNEISFVSLHNSLSAVKREDGVQLVCKSFFKENLTLSIVAISNVLLSVFDTLVISSMLTSTDVALYSVANKVVSFGSIILTTVNALIGFQIADLSYSKNKKALSNILIKYTQIMVPLAFAYYAFVIVFSLLIPAVFGYEYNPCIKMCYWLAIGQFITIVTGPCSYFAIMTGHAKKYSQIVLLSAAISIATNLIFVPFIGLYGSIVSSIITMAYKNIHTFILVKYKSGLRMKDFIQVVN